MIGNSNQGAFGRALEQLIFGNRMLVLALFALVTAVMLFFAAQLRVDAGFKKQIPLDHEFMKTFIDYEQEFGGANRVLVAVMDKNGNMFNKNFMQTMEKVTNDVISLDAVDDARVRSIFTPNVRFVEVVEDGFAGGNVIPSSFTPNSEGFDPTQEDFDTIRSNIVKAGVVGRLVAKDFSGAMVWADLVPEGGAANTKLDYQKIAGEFESIRAKYEERPHDPRDRIRQDGWRHRRRRALGDQLLLTHDRLHLAVAVLVFDVWQVGLTNRSGGIDFRRLDVGCAQAARLRH